MSIPKNTLLQNKYLVDTKIGEGSFGVVYKGINIQNKQYVAIKQI